MTLLKNNCFTRKLHVSSVLIFSYSSPHVRQMKAANIFPPAGAIRLRGVSLIKGSISSNYNIINMWVKLQINVKTSCNGQAGKILKSIFFTQVCLYLHKKMWKYGKYTIVASNTKNIKKNQWQYEKKKNRLLSPQNTNVRSYTLLNPWGKRSTISGLFGFIFYKPIQHSRNNSS